MGKLIAVVDYGLGNLRSVSKALESIGAEVTVTNKREEITEARAIVLPGVGAFQRAMDNLTELDILPCIMNAIKEGRPFLGICLGLQVLFTQSEEHGTRKGLDLIKGSVKRFSSGVKIPHMGWNAVKQVTSSRSQVSNSKLFEGVPDNSYFYFVHSYYVKPENKETVAATTDYGQEFVSAVHQDNIWGVQFHPEKSARLGMKILENFYGDVR